MGGFGGVGGWGTNAGVGGWGTNLAPLSPHTPPSGHLFLPLSPHSPHSPIPSSPHCPQSHFI
ncbi:MAG: hypothetical protein V7K47_24105 [Nostoc sp.]